MPRGHYIKPHTKTETLQQAIFFDTETTPVTIDETTVGHVLALGWAAYVRRGVNGQWQPPEWFRFTDKRSFWEWVEAKSRPKTKLYLFCHNTNFDLPVLDAFGELPRMGWKADRLVIEAPPTIIRVRKNQRTLVLLDTLNYWQTSLAKLGESIGLAKLAMPAPDASTEEWDIYTRRDVEIIMQAVQQWADLIVEKDLGGFQPTLASQSFAAWRHRFMRSKVLIDNNQPALACARSCYHGGRVEAYHIGKLSGVYHLVDINGMYPAVMRNNRFPTKLRHYSRHLTPQKLAYLLRRYLVCAHVRVRVTEPVVGKFIDDKYIFPVGEFDTHLSTPELLYVHKHHKIVNVYEASCYASANLFRSFVDTMYAWRLEFGESGNDVYKYMIKILLNSLYGKFGQRGIRFEDFDTTPDLSLDTWTEVNIQSGKVDRFRQLMGIIQRLEREDESSHSHPAIAAHVTAYARMLQWQYMQTAGRQNVFYGDTDSLLVNDTGLAHLKPYIDNTRLGHLKHEGTFDDCEIWGAKDYRFNATLKLKGVRSAALWTAPNTVEQERWSGLKGLLRAGKMDMPFTATQEKILSRAYNKGVVRHDGVVEPFVLGG